MKWPLFLRFRRTTLLLVGYLAVLAGMFAGVVVALASSRGQRGCCSPTCSILPTYWLAYRTYLCGILGLTMMQMIGLYMLIVVVTTLRHSKTDHPIYAKITDKKQYEELVQ